jgi:hypothetical protein
MEGYRPEIDGLRVIAVGCVAVYRANFDVFGAAKPSSGSEAGQIRRRDASSTQY